MQRHAVVCRKALGLGHSLVIGNCVHWSFPNCHTFQLFQTIPDQHVEFFAERVVFHAVDNLAGESVDEHAARGFKANAAAAQIVDGFVVALSDGRAMRALPVVGLNLKLRRHAGAGLVGKQQVRVRLLLFELLLGGPY